MADVGHGILCYFINCRTDRLSQFHRVTFAPILQENKLRLFLHHVIVNGKYINSRASQNLYHRLQFRTRHGKFTCDDSIVIHSGKGRPSPGAHLTAHLTAMHPEMPLEDSFVHSIARLTPYAEDFVDWA